MDARLVATNYKDEDYFENNRYGLLLLSNMELLSFGFESGIVYDKSGEAKVGRDGGSISCPIGEWLFLHKDDKFIPVGSTDFCVFCNNEIIWAALGKTVEMLDYPRLSPHTCNNYRSGRKALDKSLQPAILKGTINKGASVATSNVSQQIEEEIERLIPGIVQVVKENSGIADTQHKLQVAVSRINTTVDDINIALKSTAAGLKQDMAKDLDVAIEEAEGRMRQSANVLTHSIGEIVARTIRDSVPQEHVLVVKDESGKTLRQGLLPEGMSVPAVDPYLIVSSDTIEIVETVCKIADSDGYALLLVTGDHGTGKSSLGRQIAARRGSPFGLISFGAKAEPGSIIGEHRFTPERGTFFVPGLFPQYTGVPGAVVVCDEYNRTENPKVHGPLYDWLQNGSFVTDDGQTFRIAPGVIIVATMNQGYDYNGIDTLDLAMRGRFFETTMSLPPPAVAANAVSQKTGLPLPTVTQFLTAVGSSDRELPKWMNMRGLIQACKLIKFGCSWRNALSASFNTLETNRLNEVLATLNNARPSERASLDYRPWPR